ncbi:MAG: hypothetical protein UR26_C0005G0023 [candidate division TM6 bacterium GW2011_GWF2_32_72]|nr:MAG: hypothetical protein UR26_C0005G0023 [candidate division TM6 bacterium GW2011_GWF2_32_72]
MRVLVLLFFIYSNVLICLGNPYVDHHSELLVIHRRLAKHVFFLKSLGTTNQYIYVPSKSDFRLLKKYQSDMFGMFKRKKFLTLKKPQFDNTFIFQHPLTKACVDNLSLCKNNLMCLFKTWDKFSIEDDPQADLFLREYSIVILACYKEVLISSKQISPYVKNFLPDVKGAFSVLQEVDLTELIGILDDYMRLISMIIGIYQSSSQLSWGDWLKSNWWMIPALSVMLLLNFRHVLFGGKPSGLNYGIGGGGESFDGGLPFDQYQ